MPQQDSIITNDELWICFEEWASKQGIAERITKTALAQKLTRFGFSNKVQKVNGVAKRVWKGLALKQRFDECDFCAGSYNVAELQPLSVRRDTIKLKVCPYCAENTIQHEIDWPTR